MRVLSLSALAIAATLVAAPASAVVTTFAMIGPTATNGGANVYWVNSGKNATFYTISTKTATTPGARDVNFSFLQPQLAAHIFNITASFTMNASVTNTIATLNGSTLTQTNVAGSFSIVTKAPIMIGTHMFKTGSSLLAGTFSNNIVSGTRAGTAAGFNGSTPSSTMLFTSDFLTFDNNTLYDMAMSLSEIGTSPFDATPTSGIPTKALRTFKAVMSGQFSSEPAPMIAVPEPAVWAQLIIGFTLVGFAARRRKITVSA